ncbi:MAG: TIGR02391 family protein [Chloroflexi bacterium]|nr:TIGR02391 family protein [Chloroflexota bacterium]
MATVLPPFTQAEIEAIAKVVGAGFSGWKLTHFFAAVGIDESSKDTKWVRVHDVLVALQERTRSANGIVRFLEVTIAPANFMDDVAAGESYVATLNGPLALVGWKAGTDGRMFQVPKATTPAEARRRADRLRAELEHRQVHSEVLRFCTEELVAKDYFHAVFEATKSVADRLRQITRLTEDGVMLANTAFNLGGEGPYLHVNDLRDETDRNEHEGLASVIRGLFKVFRNNPAHVPRIHATVTEQDAYDLLTMLSWVHRRLDVATPTARAQR